jgi:hypothetical protein|tara:strand:+ start:5833 stop:6033 length:201 start_codon:yes stop_codon:yes gene_type:complete
VNHVGWDVTEQEIAIRVPHRSLSELETTGQLSGLLVWYEVGQLNGHAVVLSLIGTAVTLRKVLAKL